jgi:hypothetical protein
MHPVDRRSPESGPAAWTTDKSDAARLTPQRGPLIESLAGGVASCTECSDRSWRCHACVQLMALVIVPQNQYGRAAGCHAVGRVVMEA